MRLIGRPVPDRSTRSLRSLAPGRPRAAAHDPACWRSLRSRGSCAFSAALCPTARLGRCAPSLPAGRGRRHMTALPVASAREVRAEVWRLLRRYPGAAAGALAVHALAAASGLVAPRLLGDIVESARTGVDDVTRAALLIGLFVAAQAVLTSFAVYVSARLGERILAELREEFVARVLALPLATVERAGSGDLITRTT